MSFTFTPSTSACYFEVSVRFGNKIQLLVVFDWVAYSDLQKDQQELLVDGSYGNLKFYTPPELRTAGKFKCIEKINGPVINAFIQWIHNNRKGLCRQTPAEREQQQNEQVARELRRLVEIQGGAQLVDDSDYVQVVRAFKQLSPDEAREITDACCKEQHNQRTWLPTDQGQGSADQTTTSKPV